RLSRASGGLLCSPCRRTRIGDSPGGNTLTVFRDGIVHRAIFSHLPFVRSGCGPLPCESQPADCLDPVLRRRRAGGGSPRSGRAERSLRTVATVRGHSGGKLGLGILLRPRQRFPFRTFGLLLGTFLSACL